MTGETEKNPNLTPHWLNLFLIFDVVLLALFLIVPVLRDISPHPDEHQFYLNAWSIMSRTQLQNFLHVALTEYALAGFFLAVGLLTKSGVNFPQGQPNDVTVYYGRIFGLALYLLTFVLGLIVLQKGEKSVKTRSVFFAVLFFGSIGLFERFLRVNSESMAVFVILNYLILSFSLHRTRAGPFKFFWLNLLFIFLSSFTNLKSLYLALPIALINTVLTFVGYSRSTRPAEGGFWLVYKFIGYGLGIFFGAVVLWALLLPKPFDTKTFWYNIKNATVRGVDYLPEYPSQSGRSGLFYLYDLLVEYLGLTAAAALIIFFSLSFYLGKKPLWQEIKNFVREQFNFKNLVEGQIGRSTELVLFLIMLVYYVGVSVTVVHWSRWNLPVGLFSLMLISSLAERVYLFVKSEAHRRFGKLAPFLLTGLFLLSWSLIFLMTADLGKSNYSRYSSQGGYHLTHDDIGNLLKEKGIAKEDAYKKIAWFTGYTGNVGNISLEKLVEPEGREVKYILWPYWNIGLLYTRNNVDLTTHNQRAFVDKYARSVTFRFPTTTARYINATKAFAWGVLGLTWNPEIDTLVEPQYAVVELKELPRVLSLNYQITAGELEHRYSPNSALFNLRNLPDSYIFPTCYTNPDVYTVNTGQPVPVPPLLGSGKTAGLYCHSLWFRVFPRGFYQLKIEGLPIDLSNSQKVYSTLPFNWDPVTKTMTFGFDETRISAEFGVATREKKAPNLRFNVYYELEPAVKKTL